MQRKALLVDRLALLEQATGGLLVAFLLRLGNGALREFRAFVERALFEIDDKAFNLVGDIGLAQVSRIRLHAGHQGLRQCGRLGIEALDEGGQAERRMDAVVVRLAGDDDRSEELPGDGIGQPVRADRFGDPDLDLGHQQEQAEQLLLLGQDPTKDVADAQGIRGGGHAFHADATRRISAAPAGRRKACRGTPTSKHLEEHALLDTGDLTYALEPGVAHDWIRDGTDGGDERVHEACLPARRLEVERLRVGVDQVVDDRVGRADLLAPSIGGVAQELIRVLAIGQADDANFVQLDPRFGGRQLTDEALECLHAERAGLLAGGIDVVGECDLLGVARQQRDLAGGQRGSERRDDVVETGLMRHQRVGVALDDHGLAGLAHRALGLVDQIERPTLVEQRRRGRVEVLRPGIARLAIGVLAFHPENPPTEADRRTVLVADREQHAATEPVDHADTASGRAAL